MFLNVARQGQNQWWTYLITLLIVIGAVVLAQVPLALIFMYKATQYGLDPSESQKMLQRMDFTAIGMSQNMAIVLILIPFAVGLLVLWFCVRFIHKRNPATMVNPSGKINWNKILYAFILWLLLTGSVEVVFYLMEPETYSLQFQPGPFFVLLIISLLLFPLQTSFEEILFRGYLMQGIGLLTKHPWVPLLLTSAGFGLMHYMNPEVQEFGVGWAMSYYIGVGLFLGFITLLDDGLELALGIHAATNIYSALFVTFDSSALQTPAVFRASEVHIEWTLAGFVVAAIVFVFLASRRYGWTNWSRWLKSSDDKDEEYVNV